MKISRVSRRIKIGEEFGIKILIVPPGLKILSSFKGKCQQTRTLQVIRGLHGSEFSIVARAMMTREEYDHHLRAEWAI